MELLHSLYFHRPMDLSEEETALIEGILVAGGIFGGRKILRNSPFLFANTLVIVSALLVLCVKGLESLWGDGTICRMFHRAMGN